MSIYASIMTLGLLLVSIHQYVVFENWQAAMYFLVGAGFYAVWNAAKNSATIYTGCNFIFSQDEEDKKEDK